MFHKKQIFKLNILRKLLTDENSCVSLVSTTRLLALPPFFLNDMKSGILYILNAMLKKYDRSLGGIVIGYQNIKVLMDENTGIIPIGTSETEVNISVEFYIFQPKIGNYLEGVINKKSNNHIGCLVHQYFNATILKPEDIDYDDWLCKDFSVDDKVTFRVKDLDFTTLLPYIEGIVEDKNSVKKINKNVNCNVDNMTNHVNENSENESSLSKKLFKDVSSMDKKFKLEFSDNKKAKNRNEEEVSILEDSINTSSGEFKSFTSPKKKKKKEEKVDLGFHYPIRREEERNSKDKEFNLGSFNNDPKAEESCFKKKKKKREKNKHDNDDHGLTAVKNSVKEEDPTSSFLENIFEIENESSDAFVKKQEKSKVKKKKKKKNKDEEHPLDFNKTRMCLPVEEAEDNMFYSTQLEPISERKKMKMPSFSPILPVKKENDELATQNFNFSLYLDNEKESQGKEKKKKPKKRKREEKDELARDSPAPKKMKTSHNSKKKAAQVEVNGIDIKARMQIMMEEMCKKLLEEAKEQLNLSDKDSSKVKKRKNESKKKEKKESHRELSKNSISQVNGSEEKSEVQSILDKLLEDELKRVKEDLNASDKEKSKSHEKSKADKLERKLMKEKAKNYSFKVEKRSKTSLSDISVEGKKFDVHRGNLKIKH